MTESDNRRKWQYTLDDIAAAACVSIHTVRDHKAKGWLIPGDLPQVSRYIVGNRMKPSQRGVGEYDPVWGSEDGKGARHD